MEKLKKYCLIMLLVLVLPLGLVFTACGATPSNEAKGVFFESSIYDEETGNAVFEVDVGIEAELKFKVNPSTWTGYKPVYQVLRSGNTDENRKNFNLENGKIYVRNSDFEPITVQISVNDYKDVCIIRLKEYPIDIFFLNSEDERINEYSEAISANSSYNIHIFGEFKTADGKTNVREVKDSEFKFLVKSSDETVISVKNSNRLLINTLKNKPESASVTVALLDAANNNKFKNKELKVNFSVIPLISHGYLELDGVDHFIKETPKDPLNISSNSDGIEFTTVNGEEYYTIGFKLFLVSSDGVVINADSGKYSLEVKSNNENCIIYDKFNSQILVKKVGGINFSLTFWTNLNTVSGTSYSLSIPINFTETL